MNDTTIIWPARPTCHGEQSRFTQLPIEWHPPRRDDGGPYHETFRRCSYCGSLHPEDLVAAIDAGARVGGSDWKYGWPHKFYVDVPNPKAGQPHTSYSYCGSPSQQMLDEGGWEQYQGGFDARTGAPKMVWRKAFSEHPCAAMTPAKWYNEHLLDLSPEAFAAVAARLEAATRIRFEIVDGRLMYSAPRHGWQS